MTKKTDPNLTHFITGKVVRPDGDQDPAPRPPRSGVLTIIRGRGHDLGKHRVLDKPVVIGRAKDCDLVVEDFGASRRHCRVSLVGDERYVLEDLHSTNGTRVGGEEVTGPWTLREGDKIFIGETVLRFTLSDEMDLRFTSQVAHLLGTDPLTGLQSKRTFDHAFDYAVAEAGRVGAKLSILMMDMDGIKKINDTHGHLFGAFSIQQTGKIIERVITGIGQACRFGGDEFTAFLRDMDKPQAVEVAEKIRVELENAGLVKDEIPLHPTICIGVATFPEDGEDVLTLVAAADRALYKAKAAGKNQVCQA